MEVTVSYQSSQLEAAVKFISKHNAAFKGKDTYIRKSIRDSIGEIARKFPDLQSLSTMGYIIIASSHEEGIDQDMNEVLIEIYVDPALALEIESVEEYFYFAPKE